ncbi:hypothetical protein ACJIZ3_014410 [Penstemon smallii]|uniref:FYVE-type domain-containing protein n=1 Tax=Penstemon smallii TaxID=265156 RepID=A0ABD3RLF2_9LAMI
MELQCPHALKIIVYGDLRKDIMKSTTFLYYSTLKLPYFCIDRTHVNITISGELKSHNKLSLLYIGIESNVSVKGLGAVLMQKHRPIAYFSKALNDKHSALPVYERELLALVSAVENSTSNEFQDENDYEPGEKKAVQELKDLVRVAINMHTFGLSEEVYIWGVKLMEDQRTNTIFLKLLRERDFNVKSAFNMMKNTIKWRKEFGIDPKGMGADAFRVSLSSAVSSSSQGSGHDDGDAMGDVFIWGEGTGDGVMGGGTQRVGSCVGVKMDSLLPKALESAVVLDVQNIACGGRHAALVTKQGEIFSWGEESGGRLGHGVDSDVLHPKLIDDMSNTNIELVACGEYRSSAVTLSGDLYTWGDGHFGLLGHGNEVSHWVPKRVNGPLEGIHVSSISCGPWHTAVVTSSGQLLTFGDGTFGVLGHGDRESVSKPREVESLKGLRTVRAACGVWHTAAVVEVMVGSSSSSNCPSGKLFTWGDGDKYRLGHGDKESKLVPTCVAALVEPNFCQVACGQRLTVALTTSGHVYTMGSPVYGQLGNPQVDGKLPSRVEGKLSKSFVEEIACGAFHVVVLTSRTEVYTWGKGANGRLGHGDAHDRNFPTLVEALKDKQVKSIACGTNFTAVICLHKWVSGVDQSMCSGCRLPFNFKRKRHNCYNCGLVFCHSCSSKKSLRASMAPNPNKPYAYRVCDNCFSKLKKDEKLDNKARPHLARFPVPRSKRNKKLEFNSSRTCISNPSGGLLYNISKSFNPVFGSSNKFFSASVPGSRIVSRATSPISRCASPPRSTTPTPTSGGRTSPEVVLDDAKMTNDNLSQEVITSTCPRYIWWRKLKSLNNLKTLDKIIGKERVNMLRTKIMKTRRKKDVVGIVVNQDVYHVPELRKNLVSGSLLNKHGFKLVFESDKFILSKSGTFVGKGYLYEGMFKLNINKIMNDSIYIVDSFSLWHDRLGHVNSKRMNDMIKLNLIPKYVDDALDRCQICAHTKITKKPFPSNVERKNDLLHLIHSDLIRRRNLYEPTRRFYFAWTRT